MVSWAIVACDSDAGQLAEITQSQVCPAGRDHLRLADITLSRLCPAGRDHLKLAEITQSQVCPTGREHLKLKCVLLILTVTHLEDPGDHLSHDFSQKMIVSREKWSHKQSLTLKTLATISVMTTRRGCSFQRRTKTLPSIRTGIPVLCI